MRPQARLTNFMMAFVLIFGIIGIFPHSVQATPGVIVISQVYGGGGNTGATYKNDFIELFNAGGESVNITGWSVQYASAAGTTWAVTPITGIIQPGTITSFRKRRVLGEQCPYRPRMLLARSQCPALMVRWLWLPVLYHLLEAVQLG